MIVVGSSVGVSRTLVDAPLFTAQALRYWAAVLILLLVARCLRVRIVAPRGREWLWLGGVAATGLVLFNVAVVRGVAHAEPAVIAVAVACAPVLISILGPLLEGRRPNGRLLVAAGVVTAGSVLVAGAGRADLVGVGWAVVALLCEAGFTLLALPVLGRLGPWGVSVHAVWMAAAALTVLGVSAEGVSAVATITAAQWVAIGYLAVMVTAVAFLLWYFAVDALGSGRAALLTGVAPVAAAVSGALLGAGIPAVPVWLGIVVVIGGSGHRAAPAHDTAAGHHERVITTRRIRLFLIAILTTSGVLHFVRPGPFISIVPRSLPRKKELVAVSGAAELACAGLLAYPASTADRRPGQRRAVRRGLPGQCVHGAAVRLPPGAGTGRWPGLRLPLQIPLVLWALRVGREPSRLRDRA